MNIGKHIKEKRIELNMTQDELAEKLFVTRQTISNYEIGKRQPTIETLQAFSKVFECSLEELIYGVHGEVKEKQKRYLGILLGLAVFYFYCLWDVNRSMFEVTWIEEYLLLLIQPLLIFGVSYCLGKLWVVSKLRLPSFLKMNKGLWMILLGVVIFYIVGFIPSFVGVENAWLPSLIVHHYLKMQTLVYLYAMFFVIGLLLSFYEAD